MKGGQFRRWLLGGCLVTLALAVGLPGRSAGRSARGLPSQGCAIPDVNAPRDPANPLALPVTPSSGDPLQGAHFFVDGPRHGQAAGAIAKLIGINPTKLPEDLSWADFKAAHQSAIDGNSKAKALSKIADQEETQNVSNFAEGGGPGAIFNQTRKLLCHNMAADPGTDRQPTIPVFSTFFIYPDGQFCPKLRQLRAWWNGGNGTFTRLVNEFARAIGNKRAKILKEIDAIGTSSCLHGKRLKLWLKMLRYEDQVYAKLPHVVVYDEAGYHDANSPGFSAKRLWAGGVQWARGFYTNGTHFAWSIDEIHWAQDVSDDLFALSHGKYRAHFIVNTAQNGQGPKLNPHPVKQGIEALCNPPGRGLGRLPTGNVDPTFDGHMFKYLDGFEWTGVPGRSHNSNCPGGPWAPAGVFDDRFALELAQNANQKLGPGFPSQPY